jgi:hypothetical protein
MRIVEQIKVERKDAQQDHWYEVRCILRDREYNLSTSVRVPPSDNGGLKIDLRHHHDLKKVQREGVGQLREGGTLFVDEDAWAR